MSKWDWINSRQKIKPRGDIVMWITKAKADGLWYAKASYGAAGTVRVEMIEANIINGEQSAKIKANRLASQLDFILTHGTAGDGHLPE